MTILHGPLDTDEKVFAIYDEAEARWSFDYAGDPKAPHAILTGEPELHSEDYLDSQKVYSKTWLAKPLIAELIRRLRIHNALLERVDMVVSSSYKAIHFGYELASQLNTEAWFVEKNPAFGTHKNAPRFICNFSVPEGCSVLRAEELITTFETTGAVRVAIAMANPHDRIRWNPDVACGVLRPDSDRQMMAFGDIIYLVKRIMKSWKPEECPLCKNGSQALRPKDENWAKLTGRAA